IRGPHQAADRPPVRDDPAPAQGGVPRERDDRQVPAVVPGQAQRGRRQGPVASAQATQAPQEGGQVVSAYHNGLWLAELFEKWWKALNSCSSNKVVLDQDGPDQAVKCSVCGNVWLEPRG